MAGIYIHIPYCAKACHYCNFHFSTHISRKPEMVAAIAAQMHKPLLPPGVSLQRDISTVYFGGGTPSLLSEGELQLLLDAVRANFHLRKNAEITLEANPDDISGEKLKHWRKAGINRLSIGVQSFDDNILQWMNRAHNAMQARQCIQMAFDEGITNFSIDLIYGIPGMSDMIWRDTMQTALALQVPHISSYALTVEEKTALHYFIQKGKVAPPDDELQATHFAMMSGFLTNAGYHHYEISNFAKPEFHSRHNTAYWTGEPYYGFGPGAHSFNGALTRWWYVGNNAIFLAHNDAAEILQYEQLTPVERLNEKIMTGLRRASGILIRENEHIVEGTKLSPQTFNAFQKKKDKLLSQGLLEQHEEKLCLATGARFLADGIAADLFFDAV